MSDAFFAWRGVVRKRESTELDILDHPLVREAWDAAYSRGKMDRFALEAEFAGAITVNRRVADLLEQVVYEREAVRQVSDEERALAWALSNANAEEHAITHPDEELEELPF